jgi:hypothetical protein
MSPTENVARRWQLRPRAAIAAGVALLLLAGITVGAIEDVGAHRALGSAQSSLASTRRDLTSASAAASSLSGQLTVRDSAAASMRAQNAALASQNAALAAQLAAEVSAQAAPAGPVLFTRSGSAGIPEPVAVSVVVASAGPYVARYSFTGCPSQLPFSFINAATNEFVHIAPNAVGSPIGANTFYLASGNWWLWGGGQVKSSGGWDVLCRWTLAIDHSG